MLIFKSFNNKRLQAPSTHCDNQANFACFYDFYIDLVNKKLTETVLHQKHVYLCMHIYQSRANISCCGEEKVLHTIHVLVCVGFWSLLNFPVATKYGKSDIKCLSANCIKFMKLTLH